MYKTAQKLKEKMAELTRLFGIERNIFQKLVIVYKYIRLLRKDPLAKSILQKIFDETVKSVGVKNADCFDENEFLDVRGEAIFSKEFWQYYSNLETIHIRMKKMKDCRVCDKKQYKKLRKLFSKPYSKRMFALSFEVINSEMFELIDQECFLNKDEKKTWFDEDKSILHVKGFLVRINKTTYITNAHKILKYIFVTNKSNIKDDFFYSEIAEDEFRDLDYNSNDNDWRRYTRACEHINNKVKKASNGMITKFIVFNSGMKARLKINTRYL